MLAPVDQVTVTVLVDNCFDGLLADRGPARRAGLGRVGPVPAGQFVGGTTLPGLRAEHGFAALVTVGTGDDRRSVLFDTGVSPDGLTANADLLGVDLTAIEAVVLSHGHFDHAGGLLGLAERLGDHGMDLIAHPEVFRRRRSGDPGCRQTELPTLDPEVLRRAGFVLRLRSGPSPILDRRALVTGEIRRTTEFERGMPAHEYEAGGRWLPDPTIIDDQALIVRVRDRGLVVVTGCGHAGVANLTRHAVDLAGGDRVHALIGGFHLSGPDVEPVIPPTVAALVDAGIDVVVPGHCTGWLAQMRLATAFGDGYLPSAVGTRYTFTAP